MTLLCFPLENSPKRFLLGKKGKRNLVCIGINPNTANQEKLDPTSKNVAKIAKNQGYDGWFLMNLYPQRTAKATLLETQANSGLFQENLHFISDFLITNDFKIDTIWLAWGNAIDSKAHPYLKEAAYQLYQNLKKLSFTFVCINQNRSGHPTHPSPLALAQKFRMDFAKIKFVPFDFEQYILELVALKNR